MAYNDDSNGGGSDSGGPIINTPSQGDIVYSWNDSAYKFTNPPRYYKANDPYYYEVDNIPLKQLQENCLWLKDQITGGGGSGGGYSTSGIRKRDIEDLKPSVNGTDRILTVGTGNFIGRVNDPTLADHSGWDWGDPVEVAWDRPDILKQKGFKLTIDQWYQLVDSQESLSAGHLGLFGIHSNGLLSTYTFNGTASQANGGAGSNISPLTSAMWKNIVSGDRTLTGSLDLDMAFRRRWSGVFRTSVVNVTQALTIQIPSFTESDWLDHFDVLDPQVRIDLVCLYTLPVDGNGSTRVLDSGPMGSQTIYRPELVLVKGAGGILVSKNGALDITTDITQNIDALSIEGPLDDNYYIAEGGVVGDAKHAIKSSLANQMSLGTDPYASIDDTVPKGSFPSPDDLLNIAPLIADNLAEGSLQLIGQSVLPIAYVVVRKNAPAILDSDIIDIRPFMRTAELAYNERAGVGAANPPLSLANPAVGKGEMYEALGGLRDHVASELSDAVTGGALRGGFRPTATAQWDNQSWGGGTAGVSYGIAWQPEVSVYDSVGLATIDSSMSQVNGGDVFGWVPLGQNTLIDAIRLVRGRYIIKVNNTCTTTTNGTNGLNWGGIWNGICSVFIEKTSAANVVSTIYPIPNSANNANPWRFGPPLYGSICRSYASQPPSQSGTLTCNHIFDIDDGDVIRMAKSTSHSSVGATQFIGNISFERLPDQYIT